MASQSSNSKFTTSIENGGNSQHVININETEAETEAEAKAEWLNSVEEKMKKIPNLLTLCARNSSCSIFKVPQSVVKINKEAYEPNIVSIGPYHYNKDHLNMVQQHKWRYFRSVFTRTEKVGYGLKRLFQLMTEREKEIRGYYSETIPYTSHELIEMILLDACFILEMLLINGKIVSAEPDDPIFKLTWMLPLIKRDLLKLENQIPFFVIRSLFHHSMLSIRMYPVVLMGKVFDTITGLVMQFFMPEVVMKNTTTFIGNHLLDTILIMLTSPAIGHKEPKEISTSKQRIINCSTKLRQDGIKFKAREDGYSFLDIKFNENGILEIPRLTLDDFKILFLLNSIAFEQSYYNCSKHVTSYISFVSCLMNTPEDTTYLCNKKIIENHFRTDKEVTEFFQKVRKDVCFDVHQSYLVGVLDGLKYYESNKRHRCSNFKDRLSSCMCANFKDRLLSCLCACLCACIPIDENSQAIKPSRDKYRVSFAAQYGSIF